MTNDGEPSIFSKYISEPEKGPAEPEEPDLIRRGPQYLFPPTDRRSAPSEILVEWLINRWRKPVITRRDIGVYGPTCARDPIDRTKLTNTLVEHGWLVPVEAWRRDQKKWRVVRGPGN
jgi:hypothetical protein